MNLNYTLKVTSKIRLGYRLELPYTDTNDLSVTKTPDGFYITTQNNLNCNISDSVSIVEHEDYALSERQGTYTSSLISAAPSLAEVSENVLKHSQRLIRLPKLSYNTFQNIYPHRNYSLYDSSLSSISATTNYNASIITADYPSVYAYYEPISGKIRPATSYKSISAKELRSCVNGFNNISVVNATTSPTKLNDFTVRVINSSKIIKVTSRYNFSVNNCITNNFTITPHREFRFTLTTNVASDLSTFQHEEGQEYLVYLTEHISEVKYYVVYDTNLPLGDFDSILKSNSERKKAYKIVPKYLTLILTDSQNEVTNLLLLNQDFMNQLKADPYFYNSIKTTYEAPL